MVLIYVTCKNILIFTFKMITVSQDLSVLEFQAKYFSE